LWKVEFYFDAQLEPKKLFLTLCKQKYRPSSVLAVHKKELFYYFRKKLQLRNISRLCFKATSLGIVYGVW